MSNCDLVHILFRVLMCRGAKTVKFAKAEGHALEYKALMAANPGLREDAQGNDRADNIAKAAWKTFYDDKLIRLGHLL